MSDLQTAYVRQRRKGLPHHAAIEALALAHDVPMVDMEQQLEAQYRVDRPDGVPARDWRRPRLRRKKVPQ